MRYEFNRYGNTRFEITPSRAHESLWETLFGLVEPCWTWREIADATRKHGRDYAIQRIKSQPFFLPSAPLVRARLAGKDDGYCLEETVFTSKNG